MKQTPENQPFPNCPTNIDPTIPLVEFLGTIPSEIQSEGQSRRFHRWRITLPDHFPFLFEGFPEDFLPKQREWLQHLQNNIPNLSCR